MSLREKINDNPVPYLVGIGVVVVLILVYMLFLRGGGGGGISEVTQAYYTIDDGAPYFTGPDDNLSPWQSDKGTAFQVAVFDCGDGPKVMYLTRIPNDEIRKKLVQEFKNPNKNMPTLQPVITGLRMQNTEYKRPGDAKWYTATDPKVNEILYPRCPDGKEAERIDAVAE